MKYMNYIIVFVIALVLSLVYLAYTKYQSIVNQQSRLETNLRKVIDIINEMVSQTETTQQKSTIYEEDTHSNHSTESSLYEDEPVLIQVGKNSRCQFVLEAGKRRGFLCDKKSPTRNGFCRNHTQSTSSERSYEETAEDEIIEV